MSIRGKGTRRLRVSDFDRLADSLMDKGLVLGVSMARYTSFKAGGNAWGMIEPATVEALLGILAACRRCQVPYLVMGSGTNLLVRDGGLQALVIRLTQGFGEPARWEGPCVKAPPGMGLAALAREALEHGYMGLEWAVGIPGSVGGAVAMNAGAYGGQVADVLSQVIVIQGEGVATRPVRPGDMGYRYSRFGQPESIVVSAHFTLAQDDGGAKARAMEYEAQRKAKQPLEYPSAGSAFKRPPGHYAGALIQAAGLKGTRVGGAQVSRLHAGFIINRGGATAGDIVSLFQLVQQRVLEHSGVLLEPEVKILGEEA